ncbi:MAG: 1-deoxy-D-xylulose-5-phosphate synthase [Gammaproteobacteria bacterium]|nr:MAG: 1-deoxy-D-xylulose-5-phosphate synthase [Gammaproteobacteria bacterium]
MTQSEKFPLLYQVDEPADLRQLEQDQLLPLADELREFLVESVAGSGGHLAAGLGTVELSIALHYVFNTPEDRLIWDVGHQTYPHKILTGRRNQMHTLRKQDGLSGFPRREESEYDCFGVGHAGTSISAALGMALAAKKEDKQRKVIAVIGDGAMTSGMAFEALNHAGDLNADMLVVLNDNNMSISPNVGAMSSYLTKILTSKLLSSVREGGKMVLKHMPPVKEIARRAEEHMKGMISPGTLFEEMGFNYYGPIDGHDVNSLVKVLHNIQSMHGPIFLHVVTQKGKGYAPAEEDPVAYHGVGPFEPEKGLSLAANKSAPSYSDVFGQWLCDMAEKDDKLLGVTPAMREGSGMVEFAQRFPEQYVDVGIAEQHAVTFAAGAACEGLKPVVAIYSTFLQRGYDQLIHDVAIQNLPVLFAVDRGGSVGADGATHTGSFDYSFMRCIPNMVIMAPADENECRQMLYTGYTLEGPASVRYPRGKGPGVSVERQMEAIPIGKAELRRSGERVLILAFGSVVTAAMQAGDELGATVVNMRFVKPLDEDLILQLAASHELVVTVEDNVIAGGAGSAVNECLTSHLSNVSILNLGLPDQFMEHAEREVQLSRSGLDVDGIRNAVKYYLDRQGQDDPMVTGAAANFVQV